MLERDLSGPVVAWLRAKGMRVYTEVPCQGRGVDVVGVDASGDMTAVELKPALTNRVVRQAFQARIFARWCYCAVSRTPRSLARAIELELGVLVVKGGQVVEVARPFGSDQRWPRQVEKVARWCSGPEPDSPGGTPSLAGDGPAVQCKARVDRYLAAHPGASWREIFENVPNHYQSARSMQGALGKVDNRLDEGRRAREARDRIERYLRDHAGAGWKVIFSEVETDFSNVQQLRGALCYHCEGFYRRTCEQMGESGWMAG